MDGRYEQICSYIDGKRGEMIQFWKELVNNESSTFMPEGVRRGGEMLKKAFEAEGFACRLIDVGGNGPTLAGILGAECGGRPIVFSGHMDTVFPPAQFGENPFRIEDGKAYGPGVLDMKGGIVISLYVIKALNFIGYGETPLKILYSGDEECCHKGGRGAQVMRDESADGLFAFNMETGLADNRLCVGRKGSMVVNLSVKGLSAHAGNDFLAGRSAIEEMAHKVLALQALTDLDVGTTVNVGLISGGSIVNSVPSSCDIAVDIRYGQKSEEKRVRSAVEAIRRKRHVEGTSASWNVDREMPIYETTEGVKRFYDLVCRTAEETGVEKPGSAVLGGVSDASHVTVAGTPVICSFGVLGQWNHTDREYALVETLFERAKLISAVILNHSKF